jgi:hypothetical protein
VRPSLGSLVGCAVVFLAAGCGGLKLVPGSGKVFVDGQPITRGTVTYKPDTARGNQAGFEPLGVIRPDGTYSPACPDH